MAHSIGSCLMDSTIEPYLASWRARVDLKGVGVQGDDSMIERRMFGVLNLRERKRDCLSSLICSKSCITTH